MIESTQKISDQDSAITTTILCEDSLDISIVGKLHEILVDAIDSGHPVNIDLSGATKIDTSCIQLLFAFYHEAKNKHLNVEWSTDNRLFNEISSLTGLGNFISQTENTV